MAGDLCQVPQTRKTHEPAHSHPSLCRSVTLGMGVGSDLELLSAKAVLLALVYPLLTQKECKARTVTWYGIQGGR